ncbi:MAG: formylglycine-generating enzyme family protein, partial [Thermodesulfovibrionales bacterium]|nr:formylglycine-generating enzyme family protein [Thermodesulfovibrionales bacterium]
LEEALWNTKMEMMRKAYNQVLEHDKRDVKPQQKADAWKYFSESFAEDNHYSKEDDEMRQKAKNQVEYWTSMETGIMKDNVTGMELVFVKGGCYQIGEEDDAHEVCVDDFYIGKYEVTQGQWKAINGTGNNPSHFKDCGDNCPVENLSWNDAQDFINKLNQKTKNNPQAPFTKGEFRLPTEAEWEYAAKSGGKNEKWAGTSNESELGDYAWYDKNSGSKTHPTGQKKPNGFGLYDMSGNVSEWVNDWYDSDYYKNSPKDNPKGPSSGSDKVLRGGSWSGGKGIAVRDSWGRRTVFGTVRRVYNSSLGFRLVSTP